MKIMYTPVNPSFTIYKWGVRGSLLHGNMPEEMPHSAYVPMTGCQAYAG